MGLSVGTWGEILIGTIMGLSVAILMELSVGFLRLPVGINMGLSFEFILELSVRIWMKILNGMFMELSVEL